MSRDRDDLRQRASAVIAAARDGAPLRRGPALVALTLGSLQAVASQIGLLDDPRTLLVGSVVAVAATAPVFGTVLALGYLHERWPRPIRIPDLLLLLALLGASRLVLLRFLRDQLDLPTTLPTSMRILLGAMQGIAWGVVVCMYYANADAFALARREIADQTAQLEWTARAQSAMSGILAQELAKTVGARVSETMERGRRLALQALDLTDSEQALRRVAGAIRSGVDDDIRPMSHQLWGEPPTEQMKLSVPTVLKYGCYSRPYPFRILLLASLAFGIPMVTHMTNVEPSIVMFVLQMVTLATILALTDRYIRPRARRQALAFWSGIAVACLVIALIPLVMLAQSWSSTDVKYWSILTSSGGAMVIIGLSIVQGLGGTRESVLARARSSLSDAELSQRLQARELAEASRILARHLHSSLQGRLMAIALELERAADQGSREIAWEAVHRLEALLDTPLIDELEPQAVDVRAALEKLTAQWAAIITVNYDIRIDEQVPLRRGDLVVGIAEEAMANAVRHAHATEVRISVQQDGDDVVVRVANNGSRRISGEPGLGSRLLDSMSPDNWSLTSGPDGAILDVRLPGLAVTEAVA